MKLKRWIKKSKLKGKGKMKPQRLNQQKLKMHSGLAASLLYSYHAAIQSQSTLQLLQL